MSDSDLEASIAEAVEHHRAGRFDVAGRMYTSILSRAPGLPRILHNLGMIHLQRREFDQALALLSQAASADPDDQQMWISYGHALVSAGHYEAADQLVASRAAVTPEARGLNMRLRQAWAAQQLAEDRLDAAERLYQDLTDLSPDDSEAHTDLGYVRLRRGDHQGGLSSLRRAVTLDPDNVRALVNLSSAQLALGDHEASIAACRRALALDPANGAAHQNLGVALAATGRRDEGLQALDLAIGDDAERGPAQFRRSLVRLLNGDFVGGWRDYEARWTTDAFLKTSGTVATPEIQAWLDLDVSVSDLEGARVLLLSEQGIGDQIMFASMVADLARVAAEITLVCDPRLVGLFSQSFPDVRVCDPRTAAVTRSSFDKVLAMGGLGRLFRNQVGDFPGAPYLRPGDAARDRWRERLGMGRERLRIGVSWRGGMAATRASQRSLALEQLAPILDLPEVEAVSLQYGDVAAEVAAFNARRSRPLRTFPAGEIDDFEDLAALIETLDVVVSVQTAVVHLTGALGQEGLAMIPTQPEWRYGAQGAAMPWYGSIRLFRQTAPGAWDGVIGSIKERLGDRAGVARD